MLCDILEKVRPLPLKKYLFYEDEPGALPYFTTLTRETEYATLPQVGKDLGERMALAFSNVFTQGFQRAVIIGTDSPDLPISFIEEAAQKLAGADAVFGPSEDGGYYLLALKKVLPQLFKGIPWSTNEVLKKSLEKARETGLAVELLPEWYDVDTAEDLERPTLIMEGNGAPRTAEFVKSRKR